MGSLGLLIFILASGTDSPPSNPPTTAQRSVLHDPLIYDPITYDPINGTGRLDWTVKSTIGPASLYTGLLTVGWGTGFDHPKEYGQSFDGFAKRYGLRLAGVATSNIMEAGLGAIWGEDPRYHRSSPQPFGGRFRRTLKMTFLSENRDGSASPAYARYLAIAGSNVLSDAWRPNSDRGPVNTMSRIGMGFGGRLLGNLWEEFWPDVKKKVFGK